MTEATLPDRWTRTTLGEIGEYHNGRGFKKSEWRETGRPIIRIQNLTGSGKGFNYFQGEAEDRHVVRKGDLLVSWAATLGVFKWDGPEAVLNQHIFKVESNIDPEFHRYLLDHTLDDLQSKTHGSGMVHITRGRFEETEVWIPPLDEQRHIVEAIETHLSHLDVGVESLARSKKNVERMRSAVFHAAVSGDLVSLDGEMQDAVLEDVCDVVSGATPKGAEAVDGGNIPFFKVGDMNESSGRYMDASRIYLDESAVKQLKLKIRPPGTVIFPKRGGAIYTNKKRVLAEPSAFDLNTMGCGTPGPTNT